MPSCITLPFLSIVSTQIIFSQVYYRVRKMPKIKIKPHRLTKQKYSKTPHNDNFFIRNLRTYTIKLKKFKLFYSKDF